MKRISVCMLALIMIVTLTCSAGAVEIQPFANEYYASASVAFNDEGETVFEALDTVDKSQINVLTQRTMHRICTAATNEEVSFAYRVAIPRQRFRWRNAFSTRWRSL